MVREGESEKTTCSRASEKARAQREGKGEQEEKRVERQPNHHGRSDPCAPVFHLMNMYVKFVLFMLLENVGEMCA